MTASQVLLHGYVPSYLISRFVYFSSTERECQWIELDCIHLSALRNPYITINPSSTQHTQTNSTKQQIFLLYSPLKFISLSLKHRQRQQDQQQYTKHGDKITIRHIYWLNWKRIAALRSQKQETKRKFSISLDFNIIGFVCCCCVCLFVC